MAMYGYTNKKGEHIEVTESHLKTALDLKFQLQNVSPNRRCNWSAHKNKMAELGFLDSGNCENYRCMIKRYQKSIGELPKYEDWLSDGYNRRESVKAIVGELSIEKRENQKVLRDYNKLKREMSDKVLFADALESAFSKIGTNLLVVNEDKFKADGKSKMIVVLSDWHIGALVNDVSGNTYNYEVACRRISTFVDEVIQNVQKLNISKVHVVCVGDMVEGIAMRKSQGFSTEFTLAEQVAKVSELIIEFLSNLAQYTFVEYKGFAGNHCRIYDKDTNVDGDTTMYLVNHAIKIYFKAINSCKISITECENYSANLLGINGRNFKFVHGDLDSIKDSTKIAKHSSIDGVFYDAIVLGHYHHYEVKEVGLKKYEYYFGSIKGTDDYAKKLGYLSSPSQGIIIVDEKGNFESKSIVLD